MDESQRIAFQTMIGEYPLCKQIMAFLLKNQNAMDTLRGIATCWVSYDETAVQAALDRLILCGAVISYRRRSGTLYALTPEEGIRTWLRSAGGNGNAWNGELLQSVHDPA